MEKIVLFFVVVLFFGLYSCDEEYFTDGGTLPEDIGVLEVSTMSYLRECGSDFDTLVALIEKTELEQVIEQKGTFLAIHDYSIKNYFELTFVDPNKQPEGLDDLTTEQLAEIKEYLSQYIIPNETIIRDDLETSYSYFVTYGGRQARFNITQGSYLDNPKMGSETIIFAVNMSDGVAENYGSVEVVTSNLESSNGIIHIINPVSHILGFN